METLLHWVMGLGGLVAAVAGGILFFFGDRLAAADQRASRPNAMSPAAQRRFGLIMMLVGIAFILLTFIF